MHPLERRKYRQIKERLRRLCRNRGVPADYYFVTPGTFNRTTGAQDDNTVVVHNYRYVITYEVTEQRKFEYDLAFIAANTNFTYGGLFEVGDKIFILEDKGFVPGVENHYIVQSGERYNVHKVGKFDFGAGYVVHARRTQNQEPNQVIQKTVLHVVTPEQTIEVIP